MSVGTVKGALRGREDQPHQLIEVLHDIQEDEGHISQDAMRTVSATLGVPLIEVYRTASFYKAFTLSPRGRHLITVCAGTACHVREAPRLVDELRDQLGVEPGETTEDGLFTVESVNCLGACALGPIAVINGEYHDHMTAGKLRKLVQSICESEEVTADA